MGSYPTPLWVPAGLFLGWLLGLVLELVTPEFQHKLLWMLALIPVGVFISYVIDRWLTRRKRA